MTGSVRPSIVVDDADVREILRLQLEVAGFATRGAANGAEALDRVAHAAEERDVRSERGLRRRSRLRAPSRVPCASRTVTEAEQDEQRA